MADAEPMSPVSPKSEGARSMTDSEMDRWVCAQCEGVPTVPKKSGPFAAFKEVMRICAQTLGLGLDAPIVVTKDFYELTGTHISGEIISLEKFRGKVTLCVNVASK